MRRVSSLFFVPICLQTITSTYSLLMKKTLVIGKSRKTVTLCLTQIARPSRKQADRREGWRGCRFDRGIKNRGDRVGFVVEFQKSVVFSVGCPRAPRLVIFRQASDEQAAAWCCVDPVGVNQLSNNQSGGGKKSVARELEQLLAALLKRLTLRGWISVSLHREHARFSPFVSFEIVSQARKVDV